MADQRSGNTRRNLGWRSLRRDISRASFFLTSNLIRLITPTFALPTTTSTSTTTAAAPSTTSSASGNRDGSFQILADGTQDIAALVGIFATDSVERYAIDYSRGYLATAVQLCLSLAYLDTCDSGLDLKALRPMFGIQDEDYVPADAVHEVCYVQRERADGWVKWNVTKRIRHTGDSLPLVANIVIDEAESPFDIDSRYLKVSSIDDIVFKYSMAKHYGRWYFLALLILSIMFDGRHLLVMLLLSILCVGVTCFAIVPFAGAFDHQSWTYYYATFGLFCSVVIPSILWTWVHMQEHHPHKPSDWRTIRGEDNSSLARKDAFAISRHGNVFITYDVKLVRGRLGKSIQTLSLLASLSILLGYICQYIEVRRLTTRNSGTWLSIQGALALIRVVVWVWDPQFDNSEVKTKVSPERQVYDLTEVRMIAIWATGDLRTRYGTVNIHGYGSHPFDIPEWALPAFQLGDRNATGMFELAQKLRQDSSEWDASFEILRDAEYFWDMPDLLFMAWIDICLRPNSPPDRKNWSGFTCRVIKDNKQNFHFIPCWHSRIALVARRIDQGAIYTGDGLRDPKYQGKLSSTSVVLAKADAYVIGDPDINKRCIFAFEQSECESSNSPRKQELVVGWDKPLPEDMLSRLLVGSTYSHVFFGDNNVERFIGEPYEVRPMYSFFGSAFPSFDDVIGINESMQENLESVYSLPYVYRDFPSFKNVIKTNNSMWEDLDSIWKLNLSPNAKNTSTASVEPHPTSTPDTADQEESLARGEVELQTLRDPPTTADQREQESLGLQIA